jgi:hypothetical protein
MQLNRNILKHPVFANPVFIWITIVIFPPLGIYLLWTKSAYSKNIKIAGTVVGTLFLISAFNQSDNDTTVQNSSGSGKNSTVQGSNSKSTGESGISLRLLASSSDNIYSEEQRIFFKNVVNPYLDFYRLYERHNDGTRESEQVLNDFRAKHSKLFRLSERGVHLGSLNEYRVSNFRCILVQEISTQGPCFSFLEEDDGKLVVFILRVSKRGEDQTKKYFKGDIVEVDVTLSRIFMGFKENTFVVKNPDDYHTIVSAEKKRYNQY